MTKMITTYTTYGTAEYRSMRHQTLLAQGASILRNLEAYLRVNLPGNQHLNRWSGHFDATKPSIDDDVPAGLFGIATQTGSDAVAEQSSWSPSTRRRRVKIKT